MSTEHRVASIDGHGAIEARESAVSDAVRVNVADRLVPWPGGRTGTAVVGHIRGVTLTPAQARALAADLVAIAAEVER